MDSLNALIGLAAAPLIIPALVDDLKQFCQGIPIGTPIGEDSGSPWPLVRDAVAVGWTWLLWQAGVLAQVFGDVTITIPTVIAVGVALGVGIGTGVDVRRALQKPAP